MYPQSIVTQSFTDPDVVAELKRTLNDRLEDSLAREIGIAAQAMQEEAPVPFNLWRGLPSAFWTCGPGTTRICTRPRPSRGSVTTRRTSGS
jgi:hypothetical protein